MRKTMQLVLLLLTLLPAGTAAAREVAGVEIPETLTFEGRPLLLNGAGIRKKLFLQVYIGALYLETRSTSAEEILRADRPFVVQMIFLRSVDREAIAGAFREGIEKNSPGRIERFRTELQRIATELQDMKEGKVMTVSYLPGRGTTVSVQYQPSAPVPGKEFADAMLRNWIGRYPADEGLEEGMLGAR